ncbi:unnamed protein product [Penicillium egyptiacum]|uniref:Major facilitator superfamily (MFS) profile domain-containing protein n=1 Tax=Penicillium egyptiacum TaxID=1303716 RepID=A0A9W4P640_9EURO|nr:unnamed protein product [Penicillium egyptiacum]
MSLGEAPSDHSTQGQTSLEVSNEDYGNGILNQAHDHDSNTEGHQLQAFNFKVERPQSVAGEALCIALICSSQLLTQASLTLSIVPQHIIGRSFGIDDQPGQLTWFPAGYSLTVGTFILIAGRLGDVFGHKLFFVGGYAWFGLWSALAGVAVYSSPSFFIFCRAM